MRLAIVLAAILMVTSIAIVTTSDKDVNATEVNTSDEFKQAIDSYSGSYTVYIDLTDDITFNESYNITKKVNVDLNGYDITFSNGCFIVSGSLIVGDSTAEASPIIDSNKNVAYVSGTISSPGDTIHAVNGGTVTIRAGHIESGNIALYAEGNITPGGSEINSSITVEDGWITSQEFALSPQGNGASVTVEGGVLETRDNAVIGGNGTRSGTEDKGSTTITMTGGTLIGHIVTSGYVACGIYAPNHGAVTVTGGTIYADGGVGILVRAGTLEVWDVRIEATGNADTIGMVGDSRVVVPCAAIVFDEEANYPGMSETDIVEIHAGDFTSAYGETIYQIGGDTSESPRFSVNGGHFNHKPADGFLQDSIYNESTGGVTIPVETAAVTINDLGYPSLYSGILNCHDDVMNIELTDNHTVTEAITIPSGKTTTLDLCGFTLTLEAKITISSDASLTVQNTSEGSATDGKITGTLGSMITVNGDLVLDSGTIESTGYGAVRTNIGSTFSINGGEVHGENNYAIYAYRGTINILGGSVTSTNASKLIDCGASSVIVNIGTETSDYIPSIASMDLSGNIVNIYKGNIGSVTGKFHQDSIIGCTFSEDPSKSVPAGKIAVFHEDSQNWTIEALTAEDAAAEVDGKYYINVSDAANAVENGDTLTLLDDATETLTIDAYSCVIDLNGYSIEVSEGYGLEINPGYGTEWVNGNVTIKGSGDSTITAPTPIYAKSGDSREILNLNIEESVALSPSGDRGSVLLDTSSRMVYNDNTAGFFKEGGFLATVDGIEYAYGSMAEALKNSDNQSTLLLNDYNSSISISSPGSWYVDLNNKTVTSNEAAIGIKDSNIHLTISNGNIITSKEGAHVAVPAEGLETIVYHNSSLTLDGVNLKSCTGGLGEGAYYGIVTNGMSSEMSVTIRNSTIEAAGCGIYFPSDGTLTIENSTITAGITGIEIRAGALNISGENTSISGNGTFDTTPNGSGTTVDGVAVAVSQHTTNHDLEVNISGGTFSGAYALYEEDLQDENVSGISMNITGGTFNGTTSPIYSENVTGFISGGTFDKVVDQTYCKTGFTIKPNSDDTYSVSEIAPSVTITATDQTPTKGTEITLTANIVDFDTNGLEIGWTVDDVAVETVSEITVSEDGRSITFTANGIATYGVNVNGTSYGQEMSGSTSIVITPEVNVTFVIEGQDDQIVTIPMLSTVPTESIPEFPIASAGYGYSWTYTDGTTQMNWDPSIALGDHMTMTATLMITDVTVSVSTPVISNGEATFTAIVKTSVDIVESEIGYVWGPISTNPVWFEPTYSIEADAAGTYMLAVIVFDADGVSGIAYTSFVYRAPTPVDPDEPTPEIPEFDITHSGDNVSETVDSETVIVTSSDDHDDITLNIGFTSQDPEDDKVADISISGSVGGGAVSITVVPVATEEVIDDIQDVVSPIEESIPDVQNHIVTVDVTLTNVNLDQMIIKVPAKGPNDTYFGSAVAYYIDEYGNRSLATSRIVGDEVWIYTDHNTVYTVIPTSFVAEPIEEDEPTFDDGGMIVPPFPWDDDDDYVPPIVPAQPEDSSGDDDTTTIVACAAAAVVAALIAAYLIIDRRQ